MLVWLVVSEYHSECIIHPEDDNRKLLCNAGTYHISRCYPARELHVPQLSPHLSLKRRLQ